METTLKISFLAALAFTGVLCGASLDQSIKQLPARHGMGAIHFSNYVKAADLKNGVVWYAIIGIGSTLTTIVAAFVFWKNPIDRHSSYLIWAAAVAGVAQAICTSLAAPVYFKQRAVADERSLVRLFQKFEVIHSIRAVFVTVQLLLLLWALAIFL